MQTINDRLGRRYVHFPEHHLTEIHENHKLFMEIFGKRLNNGSYLILIFKFCSKYFS